MGLAVGHYQPWRTVMRCTSPEPRRLLLSGLSEDTRKPRCERGLRVLSESTKGWRPFEEHSSP